ncbi:hypothetical protein LOK49_LG03G03323 [Camellia lanceoleosa]|uniref:Uncharacterized protein n=1 Tax=Camellia lanceoleosa TaxID=1840588 RepID=A0ACC0I9I3_9ERIC|nr:hypothetical protein LOK49_LG03G03323 [Camellia lanceoleosa]
MPSSASSSMLLSAKYKQQVSSKLWKQDEKLKDNLVPSLVGCWWRSQVQVSYTYRDLKFRIPFLDSIVDTIF